MEHDCDAGSDGGPDVPQEVRDAIPPLRDRLRRHANLMDEAAHIAADGGSLQAALRVVATELRSCSDAMESSLTESVVDLRAATDVRAALLLSQAIHVGSHRWPELADQVRDAARTRKG